MRLYGPVGDIPGRVERQAMESPEAGKPGEGRSLAVLRWERRAGREVGRFMRFYLESVEAPPDCPLADQLALAAGNLEAVSAARRAHLERPPLRVVR